MCINFSPFRMVYVLFLIETARIKSIDSQQQSIMFNIFDFFALFRYLSFWPRFPILFIHQTHTHTRERIISSHIFCRFFFRTFFSSSFFFFYARKLFRWTFTLFPFLFILMANVAISTQFLKSRMLFEWHLILLRCVLIVELISIQFIISVVIEM